jgi:nickel-dependent lactate racemase
LPAHTAVVNPRRQDGLRDEKQAILTALENPIASPPLADWLAPGKRVCIVFTDITRPTPNERIVPWLLERLSALGVGVERITLLNATGTHRANTRAELERLLTPPVVARHRVINHDAERQSDLADLGRTRRGTRVLISRHFVDADVRIVTGFIEPHFFAGFSGGPKGIMPGVAGLETIMSNHGYQLIASDNAAFGVTDGNPVWEEMAEVARLAGPAFLLNVSLNEKRKITGVFAGDMFAAHAAGIRAVAACAMQVVDEAFDIVVASNNGYPLDQNLYQAVKGLSAAACIVKRGGSIILAAECREGLPPGSHFERLLSRAQTADALCAMIEAPGFSCPEQWQVQIFARILRKAEIHLLSSLPSDVVRRAHLHPCADIARLVRDLTAKSRQPPRIAVLPEGPMVIPYVRMRGIS